MTARPILFSGPMVRALLEGRKTQTRRVIKPQPACGCYYEINGSQNAALHMARGESGYAIYVPPKPNSKDHRLTCPYGQPGDLLWVRETFSWAVVDSQDRRLNESPPIYSADSPGWDEVRWKPSIHMPRWASRLTLELSAVRVERLQDISEEDARAEGCEHNGPCDHKRQSCEDIGCRGANSYRGGYFDLWDWINGSRSWRTNPWVWVLEFEVHHCNVDELLPVAAA